MKSRFMKTRGEYAIGKKEGFSPQEVMGLERNGKIWIVRKSCINKTWLEEMCERNFGEGRVKDNN